MRFRKLLDIACGDHQNPNYLPFYAMSDYVVGADVQEDVLGRYDVDRFDVVDCNQELPYSDNEFDAVLSSHTIEHLKNPALFYAELQRVASKYVFLYTPHWLMDRLHRSLCGTPAHHKNYPHLHTFHPKWFIDRTDSTKWIYRHRFTRESPTIRGRLQLPLSLSSEIVVNLRALSLVQNRFLHKP